MFVCVCVLGASYGDGLCGSGNSYSTCACSLVSPGHTINLLIGVRFSMVSFMYSFHLSFVSLRIRICGVSRAPVECRVYAVSFFFNTSSALSPPSSRHPLPLPPSSSCFSSTPPLFSLLLLPLFPLLSLSSLSAPTTKVVKSFSRTRT